MSQTQVVIIGGGAAGFFAAIACASHHHKTRVTLIEAAKQPLGKVLISGGGRCNVTHHCFEPAQLVQNYPRGGKALRGAFTRFGPQDTISWYRQQGVELKTEADGRMFPITDSSQTIADCLSNAAKTAGVEIRTLTPVKEIVKLASGFEVRLKDGERLKGDRLLLATGSNRLAYRWVQNLGHTIHSPVPSLFTFNLTDPRLQNLAGVSVDSVGLQLLDTGKQKLIQTGPLLITHWGISGPAVLKLSAWGARILSEHNYHLPLQINWLPEGNFESIRQQLTNSKTSAAKKKILNYCPVQLPKRLWQNLVIFCLTNSQKTWAEIAKAEINKLAKELTQGQYKIQGKGVFKEEFVTCGGVKLKEVNFKTMESKICPGLYFAGEILDIDGVTGGFNFQSAWTTGYIAGNAIVQ